MTIHEVVGMVSMWHRFMSTALSVFVAGSVTAAMVVCCVGRGILRIDGNDMLVNVVLMQMMQVSIVQVVGMAIVLNGGVSARWAVLV